MLHLCSVRDLQLHEGRIRWVIARYPGRIARTKYEAWVPSLSPSRDLHSRWKVWRVEDPDWWAHHYCPAWREEKAGDSSYLEAVRRAASVAQHSDLVLACWCADETCCHRSLVARDVAALLPGALVPTPATWKGSGAF